MPLSYSIALKNLHKREDITPKVLCTFMTFRRKQISLNTTTLPPTKNKKMPVSKKQIAEYLKLINFYEYFIHVTS